MKIQNIENYNVACMKTQTSEVNLKQKVLTL